MICSRCLRRASALRILFPISRSFSNSRPFLDSPAPATSTSTAQPFSTPLSTSNAVFLGTGLKSKPATTLPVSSAPAGTRLKGISFLKNKDDPLALPEEEYPEWLWRCLDEKKIDDKNDGMDADLFAKSKKLRRKAAKRQRKLEAARLASGDLSMLDVKVPLTQQSIDLPANDEATIDGALEAEEKRMELKSAMRRERRAKIKENNYLKSV